jgi:hypothetical protein
MPACGGTLFLIAILIIAGCSKSGPDLAPVSGRVTLDGQPIVSTDVTFEPDGRKSPSVGRTDKDGRYVLGYKRGVEGSIIGMNTVRISTVTKITGGAQLVPARYNTATELRREVKPGTNTFDFELKTNDK